MIVPFRVGVTPERLRAAGEKAGMDDAKLKNFATDGQLVLDLSTTEDGTLVGGHIIDVVTSVKEQPKPVGPITAETVIAAYIETRDAIDAKKKALDIEIAKLKDIQERREAFLQKAMDAAGVTSMKANGVGTVFVDFKDSATIADREVFMEWVKEDHFDFLDVRVSKTAVKQRLEDGETLPPGVNFIKIKGIKIRRA